MAQGIVTRLGTWSSWHSTDVPLRLGVSACLLGEAVRFDGGHAKDRYVVDTLGSCFELVRVCPEVEIGMGVPRPTMRLTAEGRGTRLVAPSSGEDFTDRMKAYADGKVRELAAIDLDGYVLKSGSPSCGLERIKVYRDGTRHRTDGTGLFASNLSKRWPALPLEDESRLGDPGLRENFIERVFCRNRWRGLVRQRVTRRRLFAFHTAHRLLLLAHDGAAFRRMGRLVRGAGAMPNRELLARYELELERAMRARATPQKHVHVMQHAIGHMKTVLGATEKHDISLAIADFRSGLLPLVVPLTLLRYAIRRHEVENLAGQLYFDPHPKELMLRNRV